MPGFEGMQNFALTPLFAKVRFGLWDELMDEPKPADDLPYMQAMWHYAQGMAAVRSGRDEDARTHHEALVEASTQPGHRASHDVGTLFIDSRRSRGRAHAGR